MLGSTCTTSSATDPNDWKREGFFMRWMEPEHSLSMSKLNGGTMRMMNLFEHEKFDGHDQMREAIDFGRLIEDVRFLYKAMVVIGEASFIVIGRRIDDVRLLYRTMVVIGEAYFMSCCETQGERTELARQDGPTSSCGEKFRKTETQRATVRERAVAAAT